MPMEEFDVAGPEGEQAHPLSPCCPGREVEARFGVGTWLYFDFLRVRIVLFLFLRNFSS